MTRPRPLDWHTSDDDGVPIIEGRCGGLIARVRSEGDAWRWTIVDLNGEGSHGLESRLMAARSAAEDEIRRMMLYRRT